MACFVVFVWQSSQLPEQKEGLFNLTAVFCAGMVLGIGTISAQYLITFGSIFLKFGMFVQYILRKMCADLTKNGDTVTLRPQS